MIEDVRLGVGKVFLGGLPCGQGCPIQQGLGILIVLILYGDQGVIIVLRSVSPEGVEPSGLAKVQPV